MPVKCETELRPRAESLARSLTAGGLPAAVAVDGLRDYQAKVTVGQMGQLVIYYSPKKQVYRLGTQELKSPSGDALAEIERCWQALDAPQADAPSAEGARVDAPPVAGYTAYVDGSYLDGEIGYGWVVLKADGVVAEGSGQVTDPALQGMRQVGGELQAVHSMIDWCASNEVREITVFYDYAGLENWATGTWQARNPATSAYAQAARTWPVTVRWEKVQSHSGDRWNDYVDRLAKQGAQGLQAANEPALSPLEIVVEKAQGFVAYAKDHGVDLQFAGLINGQAGRLTPVREPGCLDVYNTKKRALTNPYVHGFRDLELQERIVRLWQLYLDPTISDQRTSRPTVDADPLRDVAYYHGILKPYRDCDFDFIALARALTNACRRQGVTCASEEDLRYDWSALESLYHTLQGRVQ